jgi:hypothetical protein
MAVVVTIIIIITFVTLFGLAPRLCQYSLGKHPNLDFEGSVKWLGADDCSLKTDTALGS